MFVHIVKGQRIAKCGYYLLPLVATSSLCIYSIEVRMTCKTDLRSKKLQIRISFQALWSKAIIMAMFLQSKTIMVDYFPFAEIFGGP